MINVSKYYISVNSIPPISNNQAGHERLGLKGVIFHVQLSIVIFSVR